MEGGHRPWRTQPEFKKLGYWGGGSDAQLPPFTFPPIPLLQNEIITSPVENTVSVK